MYPAGFCEQQADFSGSCHFSCTLFSFNFLPLTSLLHRMRHQRKPLRRMLGLCNPLLLFVPLPHFSPPFFFQLGATLFSSWPKSLPSFAFSSPQISLSSSHGLFYVTSPSSPSPYLFLPLGMWKHLPPAAWCACEFLCLSSVQIFLVWVFWGGVCSKIAGPNEK